MKTSLAFPEPSNRRGFQITPEVRELAAWAVNAAKDPSTHPKVKADLNLAIDALGTLANSKVNPAYRAAVSKALIDAANGADLWTGMYNAALDAGRRREVA